MTEENLKVVAQVTIEEIGDLLRQQASNLLEDAGDEFELDEKTEALWKEIRKFIKHKKPRAHQLTAAHLESAF